MKLVYYKGISTLIILLEGVFKNLQNPSTPKKHTFYIHKFYGFCFTYFHPPLFPKSPYQIMVNVKTSF